jgi:hypothetical protein
VRTGWRSLHGIARALVRVDERLGQSAHNGLLTRDDRSRRKETRLKAGKEAPPCQSVSFYLSIEVKLVSGLTGVLLRSCHLQLEI